MRKVVLPLKHVVRVWVRRPYADCAIPVNRDIRSAIEQIVPAALRYVDPRAWPLRQSRKDLSVFVAE